VKYRELEAKFQAMSKSKVFIFSFDNMDVGDKF
jgi:hypothetical protein